MPLEDLVLMIGVFGGGILILRPIAHAVADRIRHKGQREEAVGDHGEVLEELRTLRQEMAELA